LEVVWGVIPILVENYRNSDDIAISAIKTLKSKKLINEDKKFVITGGVPVGISGTTNYLSVLKS
tara:strand:- start:166 stop:357 length:192 start_codon:yes stop_codon:yes gene_type:complete